MPTGAPPQCAEQRQQALRTANRKRLGKARLMREIHDGTLTLAELVEQRPSELAQMPLFEFVLALPRFGTRRLTALNHRAIVARVNLARLFGEVSRETLDWLVAEIEEGGVTPVTGDEPRKVEKPAKVKWPLQGIVGFYRTASGEQRRLVLTVNDERRPILVDRNGTEERLVETFGPEPGLLQVAAVATAYLAEARERRRPGVAA